MEDDKKDDVTTKPEGDKTEKTIDEIIAEKQAEWEKETDRRVTDAITKREAKIKAEQDEKDRLAKLTEDEKFRELERIKQTEIDKRERTIEERVQQFIYEGDDRNILRRFVRGEEIPCPFPECPSGASRQG